MSQSQKQRLRVAIKKAAMLNRDHQILIAHRGGCSLSEIGKEVGLSRQRVWDIVRKMRWMEDGSLQDKLKEESPKGG